MEIPDTITETKAKRGRPVGSHRAFYDSKSDQYRKYNSTHYEKRKFEDSIACNICKGRYRYSNKSHHMKSIKHIKQLTINADEKQIIPENIICSENII